MSNILVCFDPGHGGHDAGAVGTTLDGRRIQEKDIVLPVSIMAAEVLMEHRIPSLLTRRDDTFVSLSGRSELANARNARLFISVHCNSFRLPGPSGIETFIHTRTTISEPVGKAIQDRLMAAFPEVPNRGVKRANFSVLRETKMPAALAELGFLSNPAEAGRLAAPQNMERNGLALAKAALDILGISLIRQQHVPELIPDAPIPYEDELLEIAEAQEALAKRIRALAA
jgi:N-acetylmuramoyl-L-alanine amidase